MAECKQPGTDMKKCDHLQLIWEVRADFSKDGQCVMCAVEELRMKKAREIYGPNFSIVRYKYDEHKRLLETLIMDSCVGQIPSKYIHFMSQLVNRKPYETILHSQSTSIGANRSSMTLILPGVDEKHKDSFLDDPDDVPPNAGWHEATFYDDPDDVPPKAGWHDASLVRPISTYSSDSSSSLRSNEWDDRSANEEYNYSSWDDMSPNDQRQERQPPQAKKAQLK